MATLPYVTATGNIERAFSSIKQAATPTTISQDFVKTILQIPGGSGNQMTSFLKKIGFVAADGTPTSMYNRFRSPDPETSGAAAAEALKFGYGPLYSRNEYMHQLSDEKLRGLIIEETGAGGDSSVATMILNCIKAIKKHANFHAKNRAITVDVPDSSTWRGSDVKPGQGGSSGNNGGVDLENIASLSGGMGLNLAYTINLNLPATSDISVFNAIFKSLKENLLKNSNERN